VRTAYRSPWQNGIAERWVGTCRRELLDHVIVLNERHLHRRLCKYVAYYNAERVHTRFRDAPHRRPLEPRPSPGAKVIGLPRVHLELAESELLEGVSVSDASIAATMKS
jgi:hypothetical protein